MIAAPLRFARHQPRRRDAFERAYNLAFAADAMTDLNLDAHERALTIIFPRIGEIGSTAEIVTLLS
jgi:isochorismate hydrolase